MTKNCKIYIREIGSEERYLVGICSNLAIAKEVVEKRIALTPVQWEKDPVVIQRGYCKMKRHDFFGVFEPETFDAKIEIIPVYIAETVKEFGA